MGTKKIIRHSPFVFRCGGGDDGHGGGGGDTLVLRVLRFQSQGATLVRVVGVLCLWVDDNNYDCHSCTAPTAH